MANGDPRLGPNGNSQAKIEAAEAALSLMAVGSAPHPQATIMSLMAALSDRCRNMADTMVTAADDDRKEAYDFSNHLLDLARRWGDALLKRKRQELAELEAFLGKVGNIGNSGNK